MDQATPDTLLSELGLSTRALNAVERANLRSVRDMLCYPLAHLRRLRGVGGKTRRELAERQTELADRFPEVAAEPKRLPVEGAPEAPVGSEVPKLDALADLLVPAARTEDARASARAVKALLGLEGEPIAGGWPSQSDVSRHLGVDPGTVSHAIAAARKRWLKLPALTQRREDVAALLESQGGVMTARELAEALLASRGSDQSEPVRSRQASAVVRAAAETERDRAASRWLQLAAATADRAALSSRLELYPRGMPAARAVKLALGALAGARELTAEQVRERVGGRYPEAEPLPERPALDALLEEAGSELRWQPGARGGAGAYVAPLRDFTTVSSVTQLARATTIAAHFEEVPAERVEAEQFERRLQVSVDQQQFLALVVSPQRALLAEGLLAARFPVAVRSLDELLIRQMKAFAEEKRIDWRIALRADAVPAADRAASRDWGNLQRVVRSVLPRVQAELAASPRHVLLTNPGLLARYDQMDFLGDLHEITGRAGGPPGLWVLVPTDAQQQKPTLDGRPVPLFTSAQWARIPEAWLLANRAGELRGEAAR